jgi:putative transposase
MTYSTDLSDRQFKYLEKYLPSSRKTKPCKYSKHQFINGILYLLKTGCQWRLLPKEYPPFRTVHKYFRKLCTVGCMEKILFYVNTDVIQTNRTKRYRDNNTLRLIIDSKSIDSSESLLSKYSGFDGHKKVKGLKLFELVDCNNLCWRSIALPANTSEIQGAKTIITRTFESRKYPITKQILGDKAFNGNDFEKDIYRKYGITVLGLEKRSNRKFNLPEDIQRQEQKKQEKARIIKPFRYKIEQNFAHLVKARRLTRIWEVKAKSFETLVKLRHLVLALGKLDLV